tara:strand:+ start:377 stop:520 length:144 start_codon:yes stop_codon:yes gene_type:complete
LWLTITSKNDKKNLQTHRKFIAIYYLSRITANNEFTQTIVKEGRKND